MSIFDTAIGVRVTCGYRNRAIAPVSFKADHRMPEAAYDALAAPIESATVASRVPAPKRRNHRKARVQIDKRFALGRRIKQLTAAFRERVGPDADQDPVLLAAVEKAARLTALAEDAAARATRGTATLDDVVRLTRLADISVRRLRLDRHKVPTTPSLAGLLRDEAGP
jgi:transposase